MADDTGREAQMGTPAAGLVAAGIGAAGLSHLECGRTHDPRGPTLRTLARTLGVSMDYLTSPSALTPQHSAALYHPGTTIPAQQFARLKALIVAMDET